MKQMLELGMLYNQQPQIALELAERVIHENLTVEGLRALIRDQREPIGSSEDREAIHNRRAGATIVQTITEDTPQFVAPSIQVGVPESINTDAGRHDGKDAVQHVASVRHGMSDRPSRGAPHTSVSPALDSDDASDLLLLQEVADALTSVAERAMLLPNNERTEASLLQVEQALAAIRRTLLQRMSSDDRRTC